MFSRASVAVVCMYACMHAWCLLVYACSRVSPQRCGLDMHTYIHTNIHTYIHKHTCACTSNVLADQLRLGTLAYIHTYMHTHTYTHTGTSNVLADQLRLGTLAYIHTCIHTHTHIHTYRYIQRACRSASPWHAGINTYMHR